MLRNIASSNMSVNDEAVSFLSHNIVQTTNISFLSHNKVQTTNIRNFSTSICTQKTITA
jgi:hypothetical protein